MTILLSVFGSVALIFIGLFHLYVCLDRFRVLNFIAGTLLIILGGVAMTFAVTQMNKEGAEMRQKQANALEQKKKDEEPLKVPQLLSEKDGCVVYKFMDESKWHYFTKCGNSVSTEKSYTERVGKRTVTKTEVITTN